MRWPFRRTQGRRRAPSPAPQRKRDRLGGDAPADVLITREVDHVCAKPVRWAEPALPSPSVHLGFADGSEVELDDTHPGTQALREVAATLLVQGDR